MEPCAGQDKIFYDLKYRNHPHNFNGGWFPFICAEGTSQADMFTCQFLRLFIYFATAPLTMFRTIGYSPNAFIQVVSHNNWLKHVFDD